MKTLVLAIVLTIFTSCSKKDGLFSSGCLNSYDTPSGCYIVQDFGIDENCDGTPVYVIEATKNGKTVYINSTQSTWLNAQLGLEICF